jgi:hypothetical protein
MINYLALFSAVFISAVAAYYSIVGLVAIFAAAAIPIIIMGTALEMSKLVAASWVYRNWDIAPRIVKYYLVGAVVLLMFITSMGIFGFLSKAHMDQTLGVNTNSVIIKNIEREIESEESNIRNNQRSLDILDRLVSETDTIRANAIRNKQKRERELISNSIRDSSNQIANLNGKLTPLRQESAAAAAEVGPIKYIADLIYEEQSDKHLDAAIRWVIIIIVMVFDPLAVILLIAANIGLNKQPAPASIQGKKPRQKKDTSWIDTTRDFLEKKKNDVVRINRKSIMKID